MEIKRGNTVVCDVYLKDNSYTVEEIMGEDTLTLNFLSRNVVELQINDYIDFEGTKYKIRHNEKVTKRETSLGWEYTVMFYSSRYDLLDVEFFLHGAPERKKNFDYYTGTARDWLELFVKNMNRGESGWVAGSCIESRMITLSFKDKKVGTVLDELIKELDSEYWISGQTMNIGRREYSSNGLVLAQGEGMGFTELEVSAVDDTPPITVLYPYGSDKNLGPDYGADYLLLPGGQLSIEKNVDKYGRIEKSMQFDHIFPKGEFTVTEKIDDYTLKSNIDFNITGCLLDGVEVIVTFQDGGLAGYDLAIVEDSWDNDLKQFKLKVNDQENALKVPGDVNFSVGDKFILTGLKMPQSYIDKASQQLLEESQTWLDEHCDKRIQLRGKCEEKTFRLQNIFVACGQMVGVYSEQLKIDREIRVTKVKRYIEKDGIPSFRYELTLSDFLESNGFKDLVDDVNKVPKEIEDKVKPVREHSKRSWKDVMETLGMMFDPEGDYFTELIKPLAIHTAQLIVGTNSQQMDLVGVKFIPNADNDANYFRNTAGKLVHFTISDTVREWTIPAASYRLNNSLAYYVYAKCPKDGSNGSIYITDRQIKLEDETGYYHFWVGVLNTPEDGVRSWLPNYGYTEVAGQTITTGLIKDKLARLIIDLVNARIIATNGATIEGVIKFLSGSSGLYNMSEWPSVNGDIEDAYGMGYNAFQKAGTAYDKATAAEKAAADKAAEAERTVKNNLAYQLGFKDYAAMVAAGRLSSVLIDGGVISAAVVDAAAIVTKAFSAEMITTGNLTVTDGAKVADFNVKLGSLKYVGDAYSNTAKLYIGNVDSGNPNTGGARITALGIDTPYTVSNAKVQTAHIKNMFIDNVSTSDKKTSMLIKTDYGIKNTALAVFGNVAVTGNVTGLGIPIGNIPNADTGYDHNCSLVNAGTYTLPTGESIKDWFGDNPNSWKAYCGNKGGMDAQDYDLYIACAYWATGSAIINGNTNGNSDYSLLSGTPLYGINVVRSGAGYVELKPGQTGHFKKIGRTWYCLGIN
ncbi:hypothetical protein [Parabacteroides sp. AF17-28]|jgi:hypothetical protein|uniref:hypothetical protein n=1 Tax=Parabacteroides sp. AF17-28 TaxID=2292241 RepID=UPI001F1D653B|nr:hypothetical protein [Parabacteroides sp. AF17-28]